MKKNIVKCIIGMMALAVAVIIFKAIFLSLTKKDAAESDTARQIDRIDNIIATTMDTLKLNNLLLEAEEMKRTADKGEEEFEQAVGRLQERLDYLRSLPEDSLKIERTRIRHNRKLLRSVKAR